MSATRTAAIAAAITAKKTNKRILSKARRFFGGPCRLSVHRRAWGRQRPGILSDRMVKRRAIRALFNRHAKGWGFYAAGGQGTILPEGTMAGAVTVQLTMLAAGAFLLVLELLLLRLTGIGAAETVHVPDWLADAGLWPHAAIIVGIALLDLLLVSPLRLGEAAYYYRLTQGQERSREATCAFQSVRDTGRVAAPQSATHEFVPVRPEVRKVPVRTIWRYFRSGYGKAVGWRLVLWGWRTLYGLAWLRTRRPAVGIRRGAADERRRFGADGHHPAVLRPVRAVRPGGQAGWCSSC